MYDKSQNLKTLEFFTISFKSFQSRFYIVKGYIIYLNYKILFIQFSLLFNIFPNQITENKEA